MTYTYKTKYEFTGETCEQFGKTLKRIRRLSDGKIGGWIESEYNLSHYGDCWIDDNAMVWGETRIAGDALIFGNARIFGIAIINGDVKIFG